MPVSSPTPTAALFTLTLTLGSTRYRSTLPRVRRNRRKQGEITPSKARESVFVSVWKTVTVTPVLKKGDAIMCNNYRPISLMSCVGKVFERCVYRHIYRFLIPNNIITPSQFGFLPGESTTNQLLRIYENLCLNFDKRITSLYILIFSRHLIL